MRHTACDAFAEIGLLGKLQALVNQGFFQWTMKKET